MKLNIVQCPLGFVLSGSVDGVEVCECGSSTPGLSCNAALSQTLLDYYYWVGYIGKRVTIFNLVPVLLTNSRGVGHVVCSSLDML